MPIFGTQKQGHQPHEQRQTHQDLKQNRQTSDPSGIARENGGEDGNPAIRGGSLQCSTFDPK